MFYWLWPHFDGPLKSPPSFVGESLMYLGIRLIPHMMEFAKFFPSCPSFLADTCCPWIRKWWSVSLLPPLLALSARMQMPISRVQYPRHWYHSLASPLIKLHWVSCRSEGKARGCHTLSCGFHSRTVVSLFWVQLHQPLPETSPQRTWPWAPGPDPGPE